MTKPHRHPPQTAADQAAEAAKIRDAPEGEEHRRLGVRGGTVVVATGDDRCTDIGPEPAEDPEGD